MVDVHKRVAIAFGVLSTRAPCVANYEQNRLRDHNIMCECLRLLLFCFSSAELLPTDRHKVVLGQNRIVLSVSTPQTAAQEKIWPSVRNPTDGFTDTAWTYLVGYSMKESRGSVRSARNKICVLAVYC